MGQLKFIGGLVLVVLFVSAISMYAISFASENDASISLANDDAAYSQISNVNSTIETFYTDANGSQYNIYKSSIQEGSDTFATTGPFQVGDTNVLTGTSNAVRGAFASIFGNDPRFGIYLTALIGFLGLALALYVWATLKGGIVE